MYQYLTQYTISLCIICWTYGVHYEQSYTQTRQCVSLNFSTVLNFFFFGASLCHLLTSNKFSPVKYLPFCCCIFCIFLKTCGKVEPKLVFWWPLFPTLICCSWVSIRSLTWGTGSSWRSCFCLTTKLARFVEIDLSSKWHTSYWDIISITYF